MTTATASRAPDDAQPIPGFDPDTFRMTVGEHLEELRTRLILALVGLAAAVIGCLLFAERVMVFVCAPLNTQLIKHHLPPEIHFTDLTDPFMTYLKVTMIAAAAISGPWIVYQIWLFVAAGLYPHERKMVTRYIPLSVTLFITGLVFVYMLVLPLSIKFFLDFSIALSPTPSSNIPTEKFDVKLPSQVPIVKGDVKDPRPGDMWFDPVHAQLKIAIPDNDGNPAHMHLRSITFGSESMMTPIITIGDYISLVITFMLTFGIAFQLPLVMLAVVSIGVVDITFLRTKRKVVFFGMTIAAAILAPGDIVTSMLALLIPLIVLYEFGLFLVMLSDRKRAAAAT